VQNLAYNSWYWRFDNAELANPDLAFNLTLSVCDTCQLVYPNSKLQLVLCEIITNAIDHGVLGLSSALKNKPNGFDRYIVERQKTLASLTDGWISVSVDQSAANLIQIVVQDSGAGFDFKNHVPQAQSDMLSLGGRGLLIINSLCKTVEHTGNGNCIVVEFDASVTAANDESRKQAIAS